MRLVDIKELKKKKILFGAVDNERLHAFLDYGVNIDRIVDNDVRKRGQYLKGIRIDCVDSLSDEDSTAALVIIMPERHIDDIEKQLDSYGISERIIATRDIEEFQNPAFLADQMGINTEDPSPTILNVELSGVCNLKCVYCPFHGALNLKTDKGLMTQSTLEMIISQMKDVKSIDTISLVGAGELFVHPEWYMMSRQLVDALKVRRLHMYTNAMLMDKKNVELLKNFDDIELYLDVSIDGANQNECDLYRAGSSYDIIKDNFYQARAILGKNVKMGIFNLLLVSEDDLERMDYCIDQNNDPPTFLIEDFPGISIISRKPNLDYKIKKNIDGFKKVEIRKKPPYPICWNTFNRMAINYKGNLLRCSCGCAGIEEIANVNTDNLLDIWKKDVQLNLARNHILTGNCEPDFCYGCELKGKDPYYVLVRE